MTKSIASSLLLLLAAAFVTMSVTACNTTEGAGQDLKNAGQGIENAADRNK